MKQPLILVMLALVLATAARPARKSITLPPDNPMAELKPGVGVEAARANCVACHSTDYIVRQPPMEAKRWEAEVNKMITVFGAPIGPDDAKLIVEYLASAYGLPGKTAAVTTRPAPPAADAKLPSGR